MNWFTNFFISMGIAIAAVFGVHSQPATSTITVNVNSVQSVPSNASQSKSVAEAPEPPSDSFTANPMSGPAPLKVTFDTSGKDNAFDAFNFGDGSMFNSIGVPSDLNNISCDAAGQYTVCEGTHTYSTPGIYTATISDAQGNQLGAVTITVSPATSAVSGTLTYEGGSFSFKYPQNMPLSKDASGDIMLSPGNSGNGTITIKLISGAEGTDQNAHFGNVSYYNSNDQWMMERPNMASPNGGSITSIAQPLFTTADGTMMVFAGAIPNDGWGEYDYVVTISPDSFLLISGPDSADNPTGYNATLQIIKSLYHATD